MAAAEVTLRGGDDVATVVVVEGGDLLGLRSWTAGGRELLADPAALPPAYRVHGRRAGVTFLHPWANRLGADAFAVAGRTARVPAADPGVSRDAGGLAIHGLAAPGAWAPQPDGPARCTVHRVVAACPAFPFAHTVDVEVAVEAGVVSVVTTVRAPADGPLPVAFGWHPYLVPPGPRAAWPLGLPARTHLPTGPAGLPAGGPARQPAERAPLAARSFDDGFTGVAGSTWSIGPLAVELGEGYTAAQVFAPGDRDVVSLEPMTAPTDALRSGDGLRVLAPGEQLTATFTLRAAGAAV